ncbi:DeoR/GlpR family DNA-binding transcription regulator [Desulfofundulus salinus]|uniref:DeoR/GlpR transcriptional regulator n=1 Tax=Desulfofundulus salinus TaxID=2419843 RepID=A0A494WZ22_9FIRM|nr:DeoR/GlpR family DNA-binding transcription regulator [Desulfofundulus salinum]RKO65794.1 DeoR/GlpR transcriptional regulator [Desulfofundulus salinum]
MFAEERRQKILEIIGREQVVKVLDLSAYFNVSEATIRRDLQELEEAGFLKRTHGGAISNQAATFEPSLAEKEDQYQAEKIAIAGIAVQLVQEGDTVMLDAGSTTLQIARQLKQKRNITIVTNAVNIAWELAAGNAEVILLGGNLRRRTLSLVGPITENILSGLYVDKLFLATNGLDLKKGLTTPNLAEAQTKKAMLNSAKEVILVADHSKFGRVSFSHICNLDRINCLITDNGAPAAVLNALKKQGIKVLVADD